MAMFRTTYLHYFPALIEAEVTTENHAIYLWYNYGQIIHMRVFVTK